MSSRSIHQPPCGLSLRFRCGGRLGAPGDQDSSRARAASLALFNRTGARAIEDRVQRLVGRLIEGLDAEKFRLVSPRDLRSRSGIVVFTARGGSGQDGKILARLRERRVCISQRYTNRVGGLRASVHFFNNEADVDTLVREAARARDER